jgi:hypothetical protein
MFKLAQSRSERRRTVLEIINSPTFLALLKILYRLHCLTKLNYIPWFHYLPWLLCLNNNSNHGTYIVENGHMLTEASLTSTSKL